MWKRQLSSFKDFFRRYSSGDFVPIEQAVSGLVFDHHKDFDMLEPGCVLLNPANTFIQNCTDAKTCPFMNKNE